MSEEIKKGTQVFKKLGNSIASPDLEDFLDKSYSIDRESVISAINNNDVNTLRSMSAYFYNFSGMYRQMIHRISTIPLDRYTYNIAFSVMKNPKFQEKIDKQVHNYIRNSKIEKTALQLRMLAILYGCVFVYETRDETNGVVHQILPATYCRTRSYNPYGVPTVEFDMSYFDKSLNRMEKNEQNAFWKSLPKEFLGLYRNYKASRSNCNDTRNPKWQLLDYNYAFAVKATLTEDPLFSPVFDTILTSADLISTDVQKIKTDNWRLIYQKAEIDKDTGEPVATDDEILDNHANLKKATNGSNVSILTTSFDVNALDLKGSGSGVSEQKKYSELGVNLIGNEIGLNVGLIGSTDNLGAETAKSTLNMLAESLRFINSQIEAWYNQVINTEISGGKTMYDFTFLGITIFNEKDRIAEFKQMQDSGGSTIPYSSALGIPVYRQKDILEYEKALGIKDLFQPLVNSNQASAADISDNGRPKTDNPKDSTQESDQNRG